MDEIAYCGLDCPTCVHSNKEREACAGCHQGGGAADCYQRKCCEERGLNGCWQCDEFPCSQGFFGDKVWRGLCVGCCEVIRKVGKDRYARLVREKMGEQVELGDYRFKTTRDIEKTLLDID
jgi:hypothetical protein